MGNKYIGETGSTVSRGKREPSLGASLTRNPAERVLMESHKRGGLVGSQQKKCHRAEGGGVDDEARENVRPPLKKGGRAHRDMGGAMLEPMGRFRDRRSPVPAPQGPGSGGFTPGKYSHGGSAKGHSHIKKLHRALGGAINALSDARDALSGGMNRKDGDM